MIDFEFTEKDWGGKTIKGALRSLYFVCLDCTHPASKHKDIVQIGSPKTGQSQISTFVSDYNSVTVYRSACFKVNVRAFVKRFFR
ncbi:hypothetical protein [Paenibacillus aceti]|uniref:hypothetical protein n=1 Tax=Paenibacillus aceti TaxID=1820010 RepID=UPI001E35EF96|nr:hypothetical protein [Paenibacillus aceti]